MLRIRPLDDRHLSSLHYLFDDFWSFFGTDPGQCVWCWGNGNMDMHTLFDGA